jgi:hypothetical protein
LLRFRYAVQVDHLARRLWTDARAGVSDPREYLAALDRTRPLLEP